MKNIKNSEYPKNLLDGIVRDDFGEVSDDTVKGLEYIVSIALNDRHKLAIKLRYEDKMTLEDIGKELGVSSSRARDIITHAERVLRHPKFFRYIKHGYDGVARLNEEKQERDRKYESRVNAEKLRVDALKNMEIGYLNLSTRSYTSLMRSGLRTVENVVMFMTDESKSGKWYTRLRNAGPKTAEDIFNVFKEINAVSGTVDNPKSLIARISVPYDITVFSQVQKMSVDEMSEWLCKVVNSKVNMKVRDAREYLLSEEVITDIRK